MGCNLYFEKLGYRHWPKEKMSIEFNSDFSPILYKQPVVSSPISPFFLTGVTIVETVSVHFSRPVDSETRLLI